MIIFGIVMAVVGFGGIIAMRLWRASLRRRRQDETVHPLPAVAPLPRRIIGYRHPGLNPISYVPVFDDSSSNDLLRTVGAAEIVSSVDSALSYDPPADSSPSSDFTSGGDSGGGGASGSW